MKKLLFWGIALFALLIAGCKDTSDNVKTELFKFEEGTQLDIVISNTSQTLTYNFRTNCNWSMSSGADWISLTPRSGGSDDNQFSIIVEENSSTDKRIAEVHLIYGKEGYIKLSIEQIGIPVFESDHDGNYEIPAEGGLVGFNISTNLEYNIDIPLDAQSWVHLTDTRAVREEVVQLSIDKNTSIDTRESIITLIDADNSNPLISFNIIQQAAEPYFNCDAEPTYTLNSDGGEVIISVDTNIEYDIITPDDTSSWLSFNKESDGNTDTLTFSTISKNDSYLPNNAEVELVDINDNILKTFSITQSGQILATNRIIYTTKYGYPIELSVTEGFGGNLVSHTYENGYGVIIFDNDVVSIPAYAFKNANSITTILLPDTVKKIGNYTFSGCASLTSVTIPDSVTTIGSSAFESCSSLTSVTIPDSVTTIGEDAFRVCSSLTSVTIGDSVTNIGLYAFYGCTGELIINGKIVEFDWNYAPPTSGSTTGAWLTGAKFTKLTIGDNVTKIGYRSFYECSSLISVTIGDSVTTIGDSAFESCSSLTSVVIPNSVTEIGSSAFEDCSSLISVTIGDSVTTIGNYAFYGCSSLTSITIPDSVTSIGHSVFKECSSLTSVYCKATTPPSLGDNYVFGSNGSGRKIYVPAESVDAYKSATNWSKYASAIVGYDY